MNFFSKFVDKVKEKKAELDDRREYLDMVDEQTKPIRRASYMKQMMKEAIGEGIEKAKLDAEKRKPKQNKKPEDFGIKKEETDPWKFLDNIGIVKDNDKTLTKLNKKKK